MFCGRRRLVKRSFSDSDSDSDSESDESDEGDPGRIFDGTGNHT